MKPSAQKLTFRILLFLLPAIILVVSVLPAMASQDGPAVRKVVPLDFGYDYDVSIGNGGISITDSKYRGTLVLEAQSFPEERTMSWHKFTQRILDYKVLQPDGTPFQWVYGVVRVYFNLDKTQYDLWMDDDANMSIWYYAQPEGGWRKCTTHWEAVPGLPKGRLWCLVKYNTRYGLAWTQPTILMKMIKLGTTTVTPSPTP